MSDKQPFKPAVGSVSYAQWRPPHPLPQSPATISVPHSEECPRPTRKEIAAKIRDVLRPEVRDLPKPVRK